MHFDKAIEALRDDRVSQRQAQKAIQAAKTSWMTGPFAEILDALSDYGAGKDLRQCLALENLFDHGSNAPQIINDLVRKLLPCLASFPLCQIPFRHQYQSGLGLLQLATSGGAAISLVLYEHVDRPTSLTACFTDGDCHEIVLAGSGRAALLSRENDGDGPAMISRSGVTLVQGDCLSFQGCRTTKMVEAVDGRLVILRLSRTPAAPLPSREFRLSDGALLHCASGNRRESRQDIYVTLLGAMGRADAASTLAEMTREGSDQSRWQALRHCLALDTETGFSALSALATDPTDTLNANADALHAQLIGQYPQLARLENASCPA